MRFKSPVTIPAYLKVEGKKHSFAMLAFMKITEENSY